MEIVAPFAPSTEQDRWLWLGDEVIGFTVNSSYSQLVAEFINPLVPDPTRDFVFKKLWKCGAPSKVCAFSWQLILDRIPNQR
jgi:hypothetical protein